MSTLHQRPRLTIAAFAALALLMTGCSDSAPAVQAERNTNTFPTATPVALDPPPDPDPSAIPDAEGQTADSGAQADAEPTGTPIFDGGVQIFDLEVLETFPHDPMAFTQGLLLYDELFLESTGQRFESTLRRVDIDTGDIIESVPLPQDYFGEGLAKVGDELIQLTWKDGQALYWDAETFELNRQVTYTGEGWGLCYDGEKLIMSDGSPTLAFRDPETFDILAAIDVTWNGEDVYNVNELECVAGKVWANVWQTDLILRIDPATGEVEVAVDASTLAQPRPEGSNVLNGIAYDETTDTFFVTGKYWPTMHRVRLVPAVAPTEGT